MQSRKLSKILFVEDEEDIRTIAQIALEDIGKFTVSYCASGPEALQKVQNFTPDMIILDMMMPGMDGIETMHELRKISALKDTPIVFLTAKVQPYEVAHYLKLGALHVIAKPFDPMTLAAMLNAVWIEYLDARMEHNKNI